MGRDTTVARLRIFIFALTLLANVPVWGARPAQVDDETLGAFLDQFFAEQLDALDVPGAAFVMVKNGSVRLARGFGVANRKGNTPFQPHTIVRAGSIVKTITALAALQLAEAGKLDLDADINQYLTSLQVPATFAEPVTMRQLLHYTGGFDSRFMGIRAETDARIMTLTDYLRMRLPPRVRAPGITRAYNDHEIALAALVVRDVSDTEIASYFRTHIFEPLDMQSSSLILPREAVQRTAIGYSARGPYPFDYYNLHPAAGAGFNTTAFDIANYMIMHLAEGRFRGREILSSEWMKTMHRTGFTHHPRLPGIAYSFDEHFRDAHRYLAKSGGAPGFMNRMLLFPTEGMGIYFVYNRDSTVPLARRLESALLDMFYPHGEAPGLEPELHLAALELQRYAGRYVDLNDYSKTRIERLRSLMNQVLVTVNPDGSLTVFGSKLKPVEADLFQFVDTGNFVAFRRDITGKITHMFVNRTAFEHLPVWESFEVQIGLLGFAVLVFALCALVWLYAAIRGYGTSLTVAGPMGVVNLVFLGAFAYMFREAVTGPDPPWTLTFDPPLGLLATMTLPFIGAALGAVVLWRAAINATERYRPFFSKLADLPIILAEGGFLFFLYTWNLLGFQF